MSAWNSPTITSWLRGAVIPLRLLLLTPLILSRYSRQELDIFYLVASTNLLFAIFQARLGDTFLRLLSYAFGGAVSLEAWKVGKTRTNLGTPNWPLFSRCYATLGVLQMIAALPAITFAGLTGGWAVGKMTGWERGYDGLWFAMGVGIVGNLADLLSSRSRSALCAIGRIAQANRISVLCNAAGILFNTVAAYYGNPLWVIIGVQSLVNLAARFMMHLAISKVADLPTARVLDREIFWWAWPALWRGLIGSLATLGAQRCAGLFLAASVVPGFTAQFLFSQNILNTINNFTSSIVASQQPRWANMLTKGRGRELVREAQKRMGISAAILMAGVIIAALFVPTLLRIIGSNIAFLDTEQWLFFGVCFVIQQVVLQAGSVYCLTNHQAFYVHNIVAAGISIGCYSIGLNSQSYWWFIIGASLPQVLILNFTTFRYFRRLAELNLATK